MKIKYFLITAVLVTAIFCSASFVKAQTTDNSALIAQLKAEIQSLMQQIAAITKNNQNTATSTPTTNLSWCHTFNINLFSGRVDNSTNGDISALQQALTNSGFSMGSDTSGTFGTGTYSAVKQFQAKYGIQQIGTVGPKTRQELNSLYGCATTVAPSPTPIITTPVVTTPTPISVQPSITITSPNGGSVTAGSNLTIIWNLTGTNTASFYTSHQILLKSNSAQILGVGVQNNEVSYNVGAEINGTLGYPSFTVQIPSDAKCTTAMQDNCGFVPGTYYIEMDLSNSSQLTNPVVATSSAFNVVSSNISAVTSCTPNWQTTSWSTCANGTQSRTVSDYNGCGVITGMPAMSQSCSAVCTPNWQCSGFESCMNGQQTQTCTDTNNCGVTNNEPALIQSCSTQSTQPTITNVSPNQGGANSTMTITGTNLSGIVEVYFYSNGQYKFSASSISPTDQNHMNFSISPVLAANENSGTYQIKAVTATGTTSNSLDFTFNATTASTTSSPAYCELIGIGTFTPNQTAPDTGSGYAKISKTGISTIAQLQAACSDSDWETLLSNYCGASNSATAYKSLVIYNAQGTPSISSGVGQNMPVNCP